ncbi:hypothetical protein [Roseburia sp. 499]|uniref:hypothetical protein n=1 Tax=Roseburia sp. 499 TaxID=1261634 RepID=UPI0009517555|nr:hypothetical protein [Roseburia sp. 499]WVK70086.1 hypothetical protein BIV20_00730 [Roseburia sp. 499]
MLFSKNKKYHLNSKQANDTLQNVFAACHHTPNTVPFDKILLRQKKNTRTYDVLLFLTALLLLVTFLSPLAVAPTEYLLQRDTTHEKIVLVSDNLTDDVLCLTLSGDGILFGRAYQETDTGIKEPALSYDSKAGTICFTYHKTETNIYIPIENAPTFHLLLSPK